MVVFYFGFPRADCNPSHPAVLLNYDLERGVYPQANNKTVKQKNSKTKKQ